VTHLGPGGEVDLAWDDNSSDETGFVIERYIPDPPRPYYTPFATVPANTPRAVLTLTQGQAFSLRVRAVSNALTSGYSNAVGGIATKTPDLVVQGRTATSITLRLDCPSVPYGYPMSGPFAVERSTNGTNFTVIATLHTSDIRYTDEGLSSGINYYYRARYIDDQGNTSAYSSVRGPVQTSTP
jgi:titin